MGKRRVKDFTDITFILDRSGSMYSTKQDVIGGFNSFVKEQQDFGDNASLTLIQFDTEYEINYENAPIKEVADLTEHTYVPRGGTALYDAIGRAVSQAGARLSAMKEEDRPDKVLFIIYTDGQENSSLEYNAAKIKEMIEHQTNKYNWDFTFLGANQDACLTAKTMGIDAGKALSFSDVGIGKAYAMNSTSDYTRKLRSGANVKATTYTDEDRQKQNELIDKHGK